MPECNMLVFQAEVEKNTQHIYGLRIELASRLKKLERKKGEERVVLCKKVLQYIFGTLYSGYQINLIMMKNGSLSP